MEEKDVTFNIERNDDYIQVMSDFAEDLVYLRIDEVIALITELVDYAIRKIVKETLEQHIDPTLEKLNSSTLLPAVKITDEKVGDFIGDLIQIILHTTHNQDSIHESKQKKIILVIVYLFILIPKKIKRIEKFYLLLIMEMLKIKKYYLQYTHFIRILWKN